MTGLRVRRPAGLGPGTGAPGALSPYLAAAAAAATFDPVALTPLDGTPDPDALAELLALCEPVYGRSVPAGHWRVPDGLRRTVLHSLHRSGDLTRAVLAQPEGGPEQAALRHYTVHDAPPLERLSLEELRAVAQVVSWLEGVVDPLPALEEVSRRIALLELLAPLRRLVGTRFAGRRDVLARLVEHVGVLPPTSRVAAVRRKVRAVLSLRDLPPLFLWGPGGVGKSTVLAKFVLDHVDQADGSLAFVFADLDRPGLTVFEPLTLLHEGVRQLALQLPSAGEAAEVLLEEWADAMSAPDLALLATAVVGSGEEAPGTVGPLGPRASSAGADRQDFPRQFADFVAAHAPDRPLLFVVDTFEMAQRRGEEVVTDVWQFLERLQACVPTLRVVIAGRRSLREDGYRVEDVPLQEFDAESAQAFLATAAGDVLPPDDPMLARVVAVVGRSPLNLELAADLLRREGRAALRGRDVGLVLLRLHEGQLQGVLYRRVLEHIDDPDIQRLAYPGLEVRRFTPDVIRHVLARPCGLDVPDHDRAQDLYEAAAREVSLLDHRDGALVHRPDVRRQMLGQLRRAEPVKVARIDRAAVRYYSGSDDVVARAEELYHRLVLGQSRRVLDRRWLPGVEHHLWGALEELPPSSAVYLATRLGVSLPVDVAVQADLEIWERHADQQVARLLERDRPERALEVLRQRPERTRGSRLHAAQARVLERLGRLPEAAEVLGRAAEEAAELGRDRDVLHALLGRAGLERRMGRDAEARALLAPMREVAGRLDDELEGLRVAAFEAQLENPVGHDHTAHDRLAGAVGRTSGEALRRDPGLLAQLVATVGQARPEVLAQALSTLGLRPLTPEQRREVALLLSRWDARVAGRLASALLTTRPAEDDVATWEAWLDRSPLPAVAGGLRSALATLPGGESVRALLAELYAAWLTAPTPGPTSGPRPELKA